MIRVLLVDDQKLLLEGIQVLLETHADLEVVGTATDGERAIARAEELRPDVVLMDLRMPVLDGVAATREIRRRLPETRVVILTTFDDDESVLDGLRSGAAGYLLKTVSSEEIAAAIRTVAAGGALFGPGVTGTVLSRLSGGGPPATAAPTPPAPAASAPNAIVERLPDPLTRRELQILRGLARGLSNAEIATSLGITEGTAKNHVSSVLGKLGARTRTQALLRAQVLRLL